MGRAIMIITLRGYLQSTYRKNCFKKIELKDKKLSRSINNKCSSNNLDTLSYERIDEDVENAYKQIMALGIKRATRQEFNPSEIRNGKKNIARLLTARRKLQIADGVSNPAFRWEKTLKKIKFSKCSLLSGYQTKNFETMSQ